MKILALSGILLILIISSSLGLMDPKRFGKKFAELIYKCHRSCKVITGVPQQLIEGVKVGQFPDNETDIQYYTLCLWASSGELNDDYTLKRDQLVEYLTEMNITHQADIYETCNKNAIKLVGLPLYKQIWEMQKCIHKNIPTEDFIFY
uniref:Odorant-binding protein 24 n=1 Tax=Pyrrhalta maculicollis TaxID=226885 RepID=A0A1J0KKB8_9CUCU|nr:odorant-binding protein 24 [Pyrrhalta maculicollis]